MKLFNIFEILNFLYYCQTRKINYLYLSGKFDNIDNILLSTLKNLYILGRFQNARKGNVERYILSTKLSIPPVQKKKK